MAQPPLQERDPPPTRKSTLKNVLTLSTGAASGQAMVILTSPILTRIYDVDAFGIFGTFSAVATTIATISTLQLQQAVLLEKDDDGADMVLRLCTVLTLLVGIVSFCGFVVLDFFATGTAYAHAAPILVELGFINIVVLGLFNGLNFWYMRHGYFRALGIYQFSRSMIAVAIQLVLALVARNAFELVAGQVLGVVLAALLLLSSGGPRILPVLMRGYRIEALIGLLRRYRTFPLFSATQLTLRLVSGNLPVLLLPVFFGPAQSGLFWLAYRMLVLPSQIVTESIRGVFFREAAVIYRAGGNLRSAMVRPTLYLWLFAASVSAALWIAGPYLFGIVFGPHWRDAGTYAAIISIPWLFETAGVPSSVITTLMELQGVYLGLEIASFFLRILALYAGYRLGSAVLAIELYAGVCLVMCFAFLGYVQWLLRGQPFRATSKA